MRNLSLKVISIILLVLFVSSTSIIAQRQRQNCDFEGRREMMIEKLQLTEDQQEAIQALRFDHKNTMIELRAEVQKKKLQLEELKSSGNYSREDFLAGVESLSHTKQNMALVRANHRMDVYELLTDDQKSTFDKMRKGFGNKRKHVKNKRFNKNF